MFTVKTLELGGIETAIDRACEAEPETDAVIGALSQVPCVWDPPGTLGVVLAGQDRAGTETRTRAGGRL